MAASPPARFRRRDAPGSHRGRPPRDLRRVPHGLMVGGGRPHARCPVLVPQVPYQVGQRSIPCRFRVPPCSVGRQAVVLAGPLPRWVSLLVAVFLSAVGVPPFPPRPPWAPRVVAGLACGRLGCVVRRLRRLSGVAFRHRRRPGLAFQA